MNKQQAIVSYNNQGYRTLEIPINPQNPKALNRKGWPLEETNQNIGENNLYAVVQEKNYITVDIDNPKFNHILDAYLPKTLVVSTPGQGSHWYFKDIDRPNKVKTTKLYHGEEFVGDLKADLSYVIGIGSKYTDNDTVKEYRKVSSTDKILEINFTEILSLLKISGITTKKLNPPNATLKEITKDFASKGVGTNRQLDLLSHGVSYALKNRGTANEENVINFVLKLNSMLGVPYDTEIARQKGRSAYQYAQNEESNPEIDAKLESKKLWSMIRGELQASESEIDNAKKKINEYEKQYKWDLTNFGLEPNIDHDKIFEKSLGLLREVDRKEALSSVLDWNKETLQKPDTVVKEIFKSAEKKVKSEVIPVVPKQKDEEAPRSLTKGATLEGFVESIFDETGPAFLINASEFTQPGVIGLSWNVNYNDKERVPLDYDEIPYHPYKFTVTELDELNKNPPTIQSLLEQVERQVERFFVSDQVNKDLLMFDILLSYSQDWINTVHYLFAVGETESGKSTILYLAKWLAYRNLFGEDIPNADIFSFLGTEEEGIGTIAEDEAQHIAQDFAKMRTYKGGYAKGSKKARIAGADTENRKIKYFNTFCLKFFAGERLPEDKGFRERCLVIYSFEGNSVGNSKDLTEDEKEEFLKLRNELLFWKVHNHFTGLPKIKSTMKRRDRELFEIILRITNGTTFEDRAQKVIEYFSHQRHEKIWSSVEAAIYCSLRPNLDDSFSIRLEEFWSEIISQKYELLDGFVKDEKYVLTDYPNPLSRNVIAKTLQEKFSARKVVKHPVVDGKQVQRTLYVFRKSILDSMDIKYNYIDHMDHLTRLGDQAKEENKKNNSHGESNTKSPDRSNWIKFSDKSLIISTGDPRIWCDDCKILRSALWGDWLATHPNHKFEVEFQK